MKNAIREMRILTIVAALILAVAAGADRPETPPPGQGKYLIVLWEPGTPIPGKRDERMKRVAEPDLEKLGGRVLAKQANRRVTFLPHGVVKQLRKHEAVSFVQRIWVGEPWSEWNAAEAGEGAEDGEESDLRALAMPKADADLTFTWEKDYTYDADGNIATIGDDAFDYDALGRLSSAKVDGVTEAYTYDAFGNLKLISRPAGIDAWMPADPATNRLMGQTYDVAGNVTSRKDRGTYVYDSLNKIVEYGTEPSIQTRRILYDANDERIGTLLPGLQRWTIRDFEGQILREFRGYDNGLNFVWSWEQDHIRGEGQLIAGETVKFGYLYGTSTFLYGGKRHYHLDHLGSVRVVTDEQGRAISENDFFPFGTARGKQHQEQVNYSQMHADGMRFAGHWRDLMGQVEVEDDNYIDYMHARYYDPNLGRFLSVDPAGAESIRLQMPQTWNRYTYALNNPLRYTDPTGRVVECVPNPEEGKPPICAEVIDVEGETPAVEPQPTKPGPSPGPIPMIEPVTPLPAKYQVTFALGVMWGNYQEMRDRNFRGADRYYHCMAHCEATLMGPAGTATSHVVGAGREAIDFWANIYNPRKQMDPGSSWKDCSADMAANAQGRARNGQASCREQCKSLAPAGLNP